jgi:hemolysin activation/secretion protein
VNRTEYGETAAILRRLLDAVDRGELTSTTSLARRLEGSAATFELLSGKKPGHS